MGKRSKDPMIQTVIHQVYRLKNIDPQKVERLCDTASRCKILTLKDNQPRQVK